MIKIAFDLKFQNKKKCREMKFKYFAYQHLIYKKNFEFNINAGFQKNQKKKERKKNFKVQDKLNIFV